MTSSKWRNRYRAQNDLTHATDEEVDELLAIEHGVTQLVETYCRELNALHERKSEILLAVNGRRRRGR